MDSLPCPRRALAAVLLAGAAALAHAQVFSPDYRLRVSPGLATDGSPGAGLSLQGRPNWFGHVGLSQGPTSLLNRAVANDIFELEGGYRWTDGKAVSLQLSRPRSAGQRLGLALNYDWPHYFVRFSYDPPGIVLSTQDSLRFSAGVRF